MGRVVWAVAVLLILGGLYLFLAGSVDMVEATAMVVCATAGTALAIALEVVAKRNFAPRPPLGAILRPLAAVLPELSSVGRVLCAAILGRRMTGSFVEQRFEPGGDEPRAAGRRALTVIGVSLAPRSFVVRGERTSALLLHALPGKPASADPVWPA